jgi:activator of Hsp90 ATPase-like protein
MELRIALATEVAGDAAKVYDVLRTTEGQRAFWTSDCELDDAHGRFSFVQAPVDLNVSITLVPDERVSMKVDEGFPGWVGSTWEWTLSFDPDRPKTTIMQFRHFGFESSYSESEVAFTAQSWAMILDRLARYITTGKPDPFFANESV